MGLKFPGRTAPSARFAATTPQMYPDSAIWIRLIACLMCSFRTLSQNRARLFDSDADCPGLYNFAGMLSISLHNRVALVTGGSRGIGAATVKLFSQAGARVVFNYQKAKP
jgi:NADPH:quinone reductase-like Zn-dependent oxidoreductase